MKRALIIATLAVSAVCTVPMASAQQVLEVPETLEGGFTDIQKVIERATNWLFILLMALAVIFFLIAAFKYLTSGGGEEVGKAHKMVMYAIVAIAVALLSRGVSFIVAELLGVPGTAIPDNTEK